VLQHLARTVEVEWDSLPQKKWEALLSNAPYAAYQQSYAFGEAVCAFGGGVHRARIRTDGRDVGLAQIHMRTFFNVFTLATIMRGPVWVDEALTPEIKIAAYRQLRETFPVIGPHLLLVMPEDANDQIEKAAGLRRIISSYHTALIGLTKDEETLRAAMSQKWRNRLRAAEKQNIRVTTIGRRPNQYEWLLAHERDQRKRNRYMAMSTNFVAAFQKTAGKHSLLMMQAEHEKERIGGVMFLLHGANATYHIGWTSDQGKSLNANNLLLWEAMRRLKENGVRTLDLGGVDTNKTPGLARFKLGAGGELYSQCGTYCFEPDMFGFVKKLFR